MKVFENRNILCAVRLHFAADVLLHYAARCNYAAKKRYKRQRKMRCAVDISSGQTTAREIISCGPRALTEI